MSHKLLLPKMPLSGLVRAIAAILPNLKGVIWGEVVKLMALRGRLPPPPESGIHLESIVHMASTVRSGAPTAYGQCHNRSQGDEHGRTETLARDGRGLGIGERIHHFGYPDNRHRAGVRGG